MDSQAIGPITIDTSLGDDVMFHSMQGLEAISRPFAFEVEVVSPRADIRAEELLGQSVTVNLDRTDDADTPRSWNGLVSFVQYIETGNDDRTRYRLTLRPWLWSLGLAADCRIFQNMTVPDIVKEVFQNRGFSDFEMSLFETYEARQYLVQYRETDLDFISRLLEEVGIYYFFRHESGKHTLVLADSPQAHSPATGCASLPFAVEDDHRDETMEYVRRWRCEGQLAPGATALADFDFTKPRVTLRASAQETQEDAEASLEIYDYPGGFTTFAGAADTARLRLHQSRRDSRSARGESNARGLAVGSTFRLIEHPREDQNANYLVTSARLRLRGNDQRTGGAREEEPFACAFAVIGAESTFRSPAPRPKPFVHGPQTATVVGPAGQEIWTDQFGRIKVQFHWDRLGAGDENSSCWVRVSQAWAGTGFGAQFVPRIGQEVIVDFLEGDPDRPIVTGSVYNGSHDVPFELPDNQTQSGVRTRSTPRGAVFSGNEIRFEDLTGNEDLFIQAEKTQTTIVKDRQSITIGSSRALAVGGSDSTTVGLARSLQVGLESATAVGGDSSESIGGARRLSVGGQNVETVAAGATINVAGDYVVQVGGVTRFDVGDSLRMTTAGDESQTVGGKLEVRIGGASSTVCASESKTVVGHPDRESELSTFVYGPQSFAHSKDFVVQSDTSITLQSGDTKILITPDGVTISAKTVAFSAGSKFTVTCPNASLAIDDNIVAVGTKVTVSSSGAQLALASDAQLLGSQVKLGSGGGSSASASSNDPQSQSDKKPVFIRTKLIRNGKPASGVPYTLLLDGVTSLSGTTTGSGLIEQKVPATVASAELTLNDTGEKRTLVISTIEKETTVLGAQHRLLRLGYYHGALDGTVGPLTSHALEVFQKAQGLTVTGNLDASTAAALKSAYGS